MRGLRIERVFIHEKSWKERKRQRARGVMWECGGKGHTTGVLGYVLYVQGHGGSQPHTRLYSMLALLKTTWTLPPSLPIQAFSSILLILNFFFLPLSLLFFFVYRREHYAPTLISHLTFSPLELSRNGIPFSALYIYDIQ